MLDVAIVGGGLCGIALAHSLQARHLAWTLFEARERLGGRVLTVDGASGVPIDLGPTWYWPATQPSIARLVVELGLESFAQPDDGRVLLLDDPNRSAREVAIGAAGMPADDAPAQPGAVHGGARRLSLGMGALVDALATPLPTDRLRLGQTVLRVVDRGKHVELTFRGAGSTRTVNARRVVIALPPRIAEAGIAFEPPLPADLVDALRATPTWMATAAKAATCSRPFWREQGHSGNAWVTHPQAVLAEVFDAGPPGDGPGALAGFSALGVEGRRTFKVGLPMLIESQFAMLFGVDAVGGEQHLQDWAEDPLTCSPIDRQEDGGSAHPVYGEHGIDQPRWQGRLLFGGSETARNGGGYLEGALNAAARLRRQLTDRPNVAANDAHAAAPQDALAGWRQWVDAQRGGAFERYRRALNQSLSRQDDDQLTQRAVLSALDGLYAAALTQLGTLALNGAVSTAQVLQPFQGLSDALLGEALRFNGGSCALSNFPFEHRPNAEYVGTIRRDLAAAWREFATRVDASLHARAGVPD